MQPAVLIRLRPCGPWRYGPGDGGEDRIDAMFRSDRLYSAVTIAMRQLGFLEDWLDATARASTPAVVFSSLFPFQADMLFVPPPATLWPPPASLVTTPSPVFLTKIRWNAARFVPFSLIESILAGQSILADQWIPDAESGCLLRRDRPASSPFRLLTRSGAAIDRVTHSAVHVVSSACVEFEPNSGLWTVARYADAAAETAWTGKVEGAFRLLADTGFGGRRSSGWGRAEDPQFERGALPNLLMPKLGRVLQNGRVGNGDAGTALYWLLSLYSPALSDPVNWSGGDYRLILRDGHIESLGAPSARKKSARMVSEGSVLAMDVEPIGAAVDVAPAGFAHPVYRSGLALALKLPPLGRPAETESLETEAGEEALESLPCGETGPSPAPGEHSHEI